MGMAWRTEVARAADLTAVVAACTMDVPEGSPGHALHSRRSARTLIGMSGRLRHVAGNMVGQNDAQSRCEDFSTAAFIPQRCAWRQGLYAARRGCGLAGW